ARPKTVWGAGLRGLELWRVHGTAIGSSRMGLCIRQGKGQQDRCVMLSPRLLDLLREYWHRYKPRTWAFPGPKPLQPLSRRTVYTLCRDAGVKAQLRKPIHPHTLRHASTY